MDDFPAAKKFKQTYLNFSRPVAAGSRRSTKCQKANKYKISFIIRPNNRGGGRRGGSEDVDVNNAMSISL